MEHSFDYAGDDAYDNVIVRSITVMDIDGFSSCIVLKQDWDAFSCFATAKQMIILVNIMHE